MTDIAICVENLSKRYPKPAPGVGRIGVERHAMLRDAVYIRHIRMQ